MSVTIPATDDPDAAEWLKRHGLPPLSDRRDGMNIARFLDHNAAKVPPTRTSNPKALLRSFLASLDERGDRSKGPYGSTPTPKPKDVDAPTDGVPASANETREAIAHIRDVLGDPRGRPPAWRSGRVQPAIGNGWVQAPPPDVTGVDEF